MPKEICFCKCYFLIIDILKYLCYISCMKYKMEEDKIIIYGFEDFNPKHICECGQMFRFFVDADGNYVVASGREFAKIIKTQFGYEIVSSNPKYFEHYFDLGFDYSKAKKELYAFDKLKNAIDVGGGIRIVNADPVETVFEFIISANNNIKRIQKIIENMCAIGEMVITSYGNFRAFPTVQALSDMPLEWFETLGAGYRAKYLKDTADKLVNVDITNIMQLSNQDLYNWLISLKGVGPKVASCIMLFGFSRREFFPVDTWVEQVYYNHFYNGDKTRKQIQKYFEDMFGNLSGLAQQYLFNMERNGG